MDFSVHAFHRLTKANSWPCKLRSFLNWQGFLCKSSQHVVPYFEIGTKCFSPFWLSLSFEHFRTRGCKILNAASTFCRSLTKIWLYHKPLSNFFVSYNCISSSMIIKPFPRTRIHCTFKIWLRHFFIRCFQSGNINIRTVSPSRSLTTLWKWKLLYLCQVLSRTPPWSTF